MADNAPATGVIPRRVKTRPSPGRGPRSILGTGVFMAGPARPGLDATGGLTKPHSKIVLVS